MTVEMQEQMTVVADVLFVITALAVVVAAVALVVTALGTRRERIQRHQSVRSFYLPRLSPALEAHRAS
ncbi:hypothetical protein ACLM5J_09885 [Nocardioides sp. Bht2]|uniref:hypothetical protein n=1 Tax=Nocardioides sp. Bht2 TaxID=3392297 RepID=UPI0039B490CF